MENLLGERRTRRRTSHSLPDFLKSQNQKAAAASRADPVTANIGEIAVEKAAALYDAGHKPMLMVGRKDPWLQPQPTPALNDVCASDGSYEFSHCRECVVGPWAGSWAAVCRGGLYEAIPKACTHRVVVDPRSSRLILILVDGTRSEGAPKRAEACIQKLEKRLAKLPSQRAEVESIKAAFRGLNKDKCRPACIIIEASGRVVVAHTGKSRAAVAVDGSFTFVTPAREGELSSGGSTKSEVDVLGGPMGGACASRCFRGCSRSKPVGDVLPAETEVASAGRSRAARTAMAASASTGPGTTIEEDRGMLDCVPAARRCSRRRKCGVPGPAESDLGHDRIVVGVYASYRGDGAAETPPRAVRRVRAC